MTYYEWEDEQWDVAEADLLEEEEILTGSEDIEMLKRLCEEAIDNLPMDKKLERFCYTLLERIDS